LVSHIIEVNPIKKNIKFTKSLETPFIAEGTVDV
jgi:hypothetical protein